MIQSALSSVLYVCPGLAATVATARAKDAQNIQIICCSR